MLRNHAVDGTPESLTPNDVSKDIPFDTVTKEVGKYHSRVTEVKDPRDEDSVSLPPKRKFEDPVDDNKRTRTEVIGVDPTETLDDGGRLHVTCISMKSRTDRRDAILRNVVPHLPQLVFFDAIDAMNRDSLPPGILRRMKVMPKAKEGAKEKKTACWASHVEVIERAVQDNAFPHLIMEDDICIPRCLNLDNIPMDGVCFITGKMNAAKVKDFKEFESAGKSKTITSAMNKDAANPLDKNTFRISSSAAYVVPTRDVAMSLLDYLHSKKHITHYDIDLFECPSTTSMWFPSPFASERTTAKISDIMYSQTHIFH